VSGLRSHPSTSRTAVARRPLACNTSRHTVQLQSSWISGLRARLCPALLEAAALLYIGVVSTRAAGTHHGTRAAPLALPGKLAEGCGTAHRRRGGFMSVCAGGERHPSYTTPVHGTMQALYLAQVCSPSTDTHVTL
jgi:hypothetical protein